MAAAGGNDGRARDDPTLDPSRPAAALGLLRVGSCLCCLLFALCVLRSLTPVLSQHFCLADAQVDLLLLDCSLQQAQELNDLLVV